LHDLPFDFCHKLGFTRRPPTRLLSQPVDGPRPDTPGVCARVFPHAEDELLAVLSLDGKCLRGSALALNKRVHLLALVVPGSRAVLAQQRVDEKTNEHKGALELLQRVLLQDVVVVGAAFCHRDLCETELQAKGH
jgi:hypothetical protein